MAERHAVTRRLAGEYRRAGKGREGRDLGHAVLDHGLQPRPRGQAAARRTGAARQAAAEAACPSARRRRADVLFALRRIWATLDGICGKRLVAALPEMVAVMERCLELSVSREVRAVGNRAGRTHRCPVVAGGGDRHRGYSWRRDPAGLPAGRIPLRGQSRPDLR